MAGLGDLFGSFRPQQVQQPGQAFTDPMANMGPMDRLGYMRQNNPGALMGLAAGLLQGDMGRGFALAGDQMQQHRQQLMEQQKAGQQQNATKRLLMSKGYSDDEAQTIVDSGQAGAYLKSDSQSLVNAGDGRLYDPNTKEWITAPGGSSGVFSGQSVEAQALNGLVENGTFTPQQAMELGAGKVITNPADGSMVFMTPQGLVGAPAGSQPPAPVPAQTVGNVSAAGTAPAGQSIPGGRTITPGKSGKIQTEGERRNQSLYSVAKPQLDIALNNWDSLSQLRNQAIEKAGDVPYVGGVAKTLGSYGTTEKYQRARNAMKTIVATYLYSTSGATANPGEVENQVDVLMPLPGEQPASVADKKQRLTDMVEAIRMAGGPSAQPAAQNGARRTQSGVTYTIEGQ
jgi:hypothetical protein